MSLRRTLTGPKAFASISAVSALLALALAAVFGALAGGCATAGAAVDPVAAEPVATDWAPRVDSAILARAMVFGLTAVDPAAYGGWAGECPGCDVDSETFARMCAEKGVEAKRLQNAQATIGNALALARSAWADMRAGDLFVFYVSSHGGQETDADGDEEDGQDETICLWDGQLADDVLRDLWDEVPAGVRVFMVTDTCNSGTNFKQRPRSFRRSLPRSFSGALIHYGGCADGESSFGDASGGTFTTALVDAWDSANTYRTWFLEAAKRMPKNQIPTYAAYGEAVGEFEQTEALK